TGARVATIYFARFSTQLSTADRGIIQQISQRFVNNPDATATIIGHASAGQDGESTPGELVAFKLGLDRASEVAIALHNLGIDKERIRIDSQSARIPRLNNGEIGAEIDHRRVEIFEQP
ncbi:MAG: OmpA family protein, partial [Pseudomonadota bacterium]